MKKRMLALLLGLLCAGLTACGSTDTAAKDETPSAPTVEQPEPEPTPEEVRRTAAEAICGRLDARGAGRADVLRALSGDRRGGADRAVRHRRLSAVCARF